MGDVMSNPILGNPANPFVVWTYVLSLGAIFGYLTYMLWKIYRN